MCDLKFRHEVKHEISNLDMLVIRQRMMAIARHDENSQDGIYHIRSLYFDNLYDKAYFEKTNGASRREKFRIRYYNGDTSYMKLEKKSKIGNLCNKQSVKITEQEVKWLLEGELDWMLDDDTCGRQLVRELYTKMYSQGIKPKTIVDYTREPFIYGPGNVRVTLDYNIRAGTNTRDFLDWDCVTLPVLNQVAILEVKWDEFLPDVIKNGVQLGNRRSGAFSKYVACRMYG